MYENPPSLQPFINNLLLLLLFLLSKLASHAMKSYTEHWTLLHAPGWGKCPSFSSKIGYSFSLSYSDLA